MKTLIDTFTLLATYLRFVFPKEPNGEIGSDELGDECVVCGKDDWGYYISGKFYCSFECLRKDKS